MFVPTSQLMPGFAICIHNKYTFIQEKSQIKKKKKKFRKKIFSEKHKVAIFDV